jgi:trimeric autotransporter adhesin
VKKKRKAAAAMLMLGGRSPICGWCSWKQSRSSAVAVSGDRERPHAANVVVARLLAEAAHAHVLDHARPQRADEPVRTGFLRELSHCSGKQRHRQQRKGRESRHIHEACRRRTYDFATVLCESTHIQRKNGCIIRVIADRSPDNLNMKGAFAMVTSKRVTGKFLNLRTFGIVGLALLLGSGPSWAGPPNPTPSDALGNTAGGTAALSHNTSGQYNTGFGQGALFSNTAGAGNTAIGLNALILNTTGSYNTASGTSALLSNTTGVDNTASGVNALYSNTTGAGNTASGSGALVSNTTGGGNTAFGFAALLSNTTGPYNTASGVNALYSNTTGEGNTASGVNALFGNTSADNNTASGMNALYSNTTGVDNTASGDSALFNSTTGVENTASGFLAGLTNITGSYDTFIGSGADANADYTNGTALGAGALLFASNSIVLGNTSISAIYANVSSITAVSDRRRKKDIRALDTDLGLDFIEKLKPVSYRFNNGDETERYGFIAQDLEQALPASLHDTIERSRPEHGLALLERQNDKDRTYRVSYDELLAPIVKSIQEQQQEIAAERQQNADLRGAVEALQSQAATLKAENEGLRHSIEALREHVTAAR